MPMTFRDREQAFEAKFAHDEEFRFLVTARRDKLLARWAADKLNLSAGETEALIKAVVAIPDGPGHQEALLAYIAGCLRGKTSISENSLPAVLERCMQQARAELLETPPQFEGS